MWLLLAAALIGIVVPTGPKSKVVPTGTKSKAGDTINLTATTNNSQVRATVSPAMLFVYNPKLPVCYICNGAVVCPGLRVVWIDSTRSKRRGVWLDSGDVGTNTGIVANPWRIAPVEPIIKAGVINNDNSMVPIPGMALEVIPTIPPAITLGVGNL
jgi:hypothetical protein